MDVHSTLMPPYLDLCYKFVILTINLNPFKSCLTYCWSSSVVTFTLFVDVLCMCAISGSMAKWTANLNYCSFFICYHQSLAHCPSSVSPIKF